MESEKSKLLPGTEPVPRRRCRGAGFFLATLLLLAVGLRFQAPRCLSWAARGPLPFPAPRPDKWWRALHAKYAAEVAAIEAGDAEPYGVIFYGDSITESWNGQDHGFPCARAAGVDEVFAKHFGAFRPRAFGIGADESAHLLWRLLHGELPNGTTGASPSPAPRIAVLNIGTNDLGAAREGSTLSEAAARVNGAVPGVAERVLRIVRLFRRVAPDTHVVLQALLPRSRDVGPDQFQQPSLYTDALDDVNDRLHALAAADGHLHFVDCNDGFYDPADGSLRPELIPDGLHPSKDGYDRIGACLAVTVRELWEKLEPETPAAERLAGKVAAAKATIESLLAKTAKGEEASDLDATVRLPDDLGFVSKNGADARDAAVRLPEDLGFVVKAADSDAPAGKRRHGHHDQGRGRGKYGHGKHGHGKRGHGQGARRAGPDAAEGSEAAAISVPLSLLTSSSSASNSIEMHNIFDVLKSVDAEAVRARNGERGASVSVVASSDPAQGTTVRVHRVSSRDLPLALGMPALTMRPAVNAVNAEDLETAQKAMDKAFANAFGLDLETLAAREQAGAAKADAEGASATAGSASSSVSSLFDATFQTFSSISDAVTKAVRESIDAARPAAQAAGQAVQRAARDASAAAQEAAQRAAESAREAGAEAAGRAAETASEASEAAREAAKEASDEARQAAAQASKRAAEAADAAMEASREAAEQAADAMRQALGRLGK